MRIALALVLAASAAHAEAPAAKEGKIIYDITEGDGKALLVRLDTIEETRQDLVKQGVTPRFIISIRGPATKLVQTDMSQVKEEDRPYAQKIAALLQQLAKAPGVERIEQCAVAIRHAGTKAENVVPPVKVVANSFVTIASYESQGYAYIRP
jgi:intracellular sulfur oxidation DsrE/DsrF family protein